MEEKLFKSYIKCGNSADLLKEVQSESVDMVLTSPPYDDIKNYNASLSWTFETFKPIASELKRVLKPGGVIIWVVADKTEKGSETGTSFKQALYFKELGLNIHDTMIYKKLNYVPLTHNRYEQEFEYMFCFSKGRPKTFNPIKIPCKYAGESTWGKPSFYKTDDDALTPTKKSVIGSEKIKGNVFEYKTGSTTATKKYKHPAMFPPQLAIDQIGTWSEQEDIVLDPFMGSGTVGEIAVNMGRHFIGFELEPKYYEIVKQRVEDNFQMSLDVVCM